MMLPTFYRCKKCEGKFPNSEYNHDHGLCKYCDEELKPCPCGETPSRLDIIAGGTCKWAWVSGSCCDEWNIEFRTKYHALDSDECMQLATDEWNNAPRG